MDNLEEKNKLNKALFEEEDRVDKNLRISCGVIISGLVVFGIISIFNFDVAVIFALVMFLLLMMINQ